jgi:serine/threonine protein kinase
MANKGNSPEVETLCPDCGKRIAQAARAGSLTSYLFQPFQCRCVKAGERPIAGSSLRLTQYRNASKSSQIFCPDCGLQVVSGGRIGSLTGFLFQSTRCKCSGKSQSAGGEMAERFRILKRAAAGNTFDSTSMTELGDETKVSASIDLLPGAVIGGQYRIIQLIGKGGMGEVYMAQHLTLNKTCALKLIPPEQVTFSGWARFQIEAKSIAALDHINLVKVLDLGIHEGCLPFYAMEYIDGQTLAAVLEKFGPLPLKVVLDIFAQICDGLDFAHRQGLVHRDLKPANIMLVKSLADKFAVKILDFGLVKLTQKDRHQQSLTSVGDIFGSPFYMSPEQCVGGKVDNRSDIYSLGCTLFESLTGRPPFRTGSPIEIVTRHQTDDPPALEEILGPNIFPEAMEVVLAKLLRKNPVERYQTLIELRGDLEKVARGEYVQPFYVSRGKQTKGTSQAFKQKYNRGDFASEGFGLRLGKSGRIASTIFIGATVLLLVSGGYHYWQSQNVIGRQTQLALSKLQQSNLTTSETAADNQSERTSFETQTSMFEKARFASVSGAKSPFSTTQMINGNRMRCFDFPNDARIGMISSATPWKLLKATGKLTFADSDRLFLVPDLDLGDNPDCLKRFRPGDIFGVTFFTGADSVEIFKTALNIPDVQELDLAKSDNLADPPIDVLKQFRHLKIFIGSNRGIDGNLLARAHCWSGLKELYLPQARNILPLLQEIKSSSNLIRLGLGPSHLSLPEYQAIATMSNLTYLDLNGNLVTNYDLVVLSQLHNLLDLNLISSDLDLKALDTLKRFEKLTNLYVSSLKLSDDDFQMIKMALPKVSVRRRFL